MGSPGKQAALLTDYLDNVKNTLPDKIAIVDGDREISFLRLWQFSKSTQMHVPGELRNSPIAVILPKNAETIIAFLATLYSGNFYVPIDCTAPKSRLKKILSKLKPTVLITRSDLFSEGWELEEGSTVLFLDEILNIEDSVESLGEVKLPESIRVLDVDPAYCIFTSGSTGEPKGVIVSHRSVIDYIEWARRCFLITSEEKIASQAPFHFDNSVLDLFLMLSTGAELHLVPESFFSFPASLVEYLEEMKISFLFWVPSALRGVAHFNALKNRSLPSLKKILFAGEVMPCKTLNYWKSHIPEGLFANLYGPTEATVDCTFFIVDRDFADDDSLPIGHPRDNVAIVVLNERSQLVEGDEVGELYIRGTALAIGYFDDAIRTAAAFLQNPTHASYPDKVYRTGDLVRYNERGELLYCGRVDQQVKHLGHRIELGEIESTAGRLEGIRDVACIYNRLKSEIWLFYCCDDEDLTGDTVLAFLRLELPKYMLPQVTRLLDQLPVLTNGKLDRASLKEMSNASVERGQEIP